MASISQIAETIGGEIIGNPQLEIQGVCDVKSGKARHITFIGSREYEQYFDSCNADAFVVNLKFSLENRNKTLIKVDDPTYHFVKVVDMFYPAPVFKSGVHETAIIDDSVNLGENVSLGPYVVIEGGSTLGNNVVIGAGTFIGANVTIGEGTIIRPNVSVYHDSVIGKHCIIDSGTSIGADGFGLLTHKGIRHKMPHVGRAILEDNVLIGANCCVDRGTLNDTVVGEGSKFDNFIQVAHNVQIGKNCVISGQTAIGGSTVLGDNITIAGQVGIIDHLTIGSGSVIAGKSGVFQSIEENSFVSGTPARPHKERLRQDAATNKLPDLLKKVRKLEQEALQPENR
ncbi:MAG: UDP-3-O-(3-hydroxymyristoyl)glucosamine N-acyltransferase [Candidatus Marinimicrobia bacterium]|nr:UDP-3-O-(3-hydroxymyristoyl)glucosamine N-acyltransferase [Candidatus Neomarinimicrobiota bacterium]MDP6936568.1 UDP-3-O-(3-hydroxymyristoyl)glucosamine N-acyltransferase [Candidatus Neomarinimicrobiota bacterium]